MIPQETVDLILDTAHIEDVVSDFVSLKRRGASYVACCPFHNEKTPSFYVTPSKGIFKCFGCGKAGTAVGFVMEHEHCSYVEALRYLARKYHIEVVEKEESAEDVARRQRSESLYLVSEYASKFFQQCLSTPEGHSIGYAYFKSRGLEDSTIENFGLGWAPRSRTALTDSALEAGYKAEYLLETGLCAQREDGSLFDRFYDRVVFPVHSVSGRVIAFGCRTLRSDFKDAGIGKYVNSKESEIYVKSRSLYGIYQAKSEIARCNRCYLVEGYLDVISMHQLGITNVVASSGTSLTIEQIRLIHKFTENVTIMYDGDGAGIHAALRGIDMVLSEGLNVKVVFIPDGDDPDSFSRKHSLEEVRDFLLASERDFIEFKTDLLLKDAGNDPIKRANLINDVADTISRIPDAVKRSIYVDSCSSKFNIDSQAVIERINKTRLAEQTPRKIGTAATSAAATEQRPQPYKADALENKVLARAEEDLMGFLLQYGTDELDFPSDSPYYSGSEDVKVTVADFIRDALSADDTVMSNSIYRKAYEAYFEGYGADLSQESIVRRMLDSSDRDVASVAARLSEQEYEITVEKFEKSMTTTSSWLVYSVPRAILYYVERRIQNEIDKLQLSLGSAGPEDEIELLRGIMQLKEAQKSVNIQLGRDKNIN